MGYLLPSPLSLAFKWLEEVSGAAAEATGLSRPWLPSWGLYPLPPGALTGWLKKGVFSLRTGWMKAASHPTPSKPSTEEDTYVLLPPLLPCWLHWGWLGTEAFLACGPGTPLGPHSASSLPWSSLGHQPLSALLMRRAGIGRT